MLCEKIYETQSNGARSFLYDTCAGVVGGLFSLPGDFRAGGRKLGKPAAGREIRGDFARGLHVCETYDIKVCTHLQNIEITIVIFRIFFFYLKSASMWTFLRRAPCTRRGVTRAEDELGNRYRRTSAGVTRAYWRLPSFLGDPSRPARTAEDADGRTDGATPGRVNKFARGRIIFV